MHSMEGFGFDENGENSDNDFMEDEDDVFLPSYLIQSDKAGAQLRLLHSRFPRIARAIYPKLKRYLEEKDRLPELESEDGPAFDATTVTEDMWTSIRDVLKTTCPIMIPFIAAIVRVPLKPIPHAKKAMVSASELRCKYYKFEWKKEKLTCGMISQIYAAIGTKNGIVAVMKMGNDSAEEAELYPPEGKEVLQEEKAKKSSFSENRASHAIHGGAVYDIKMVDSAKGRFVSCGEDGKIVFWEPHRNFQGFCFKAESPVCRLALPTRTDPAYFLAAAALDATVRFYHTDREDYLRLFPHETSVTSVALDYSGERLLSGCYRERFVRMWDVNTSLPQIYFDEMDSPALFVDFIDEKRIAAISETSTLYMWHIGQRKLMRAPFQTLNGNLCTMMRSFNGIIALGSNRGDLILYTSLWDQFQYNGNCECVYDAFTTDENAEWSALTG